MRPDEIAARVWPGRALTVEALAGGITNRNFKVTLDGDEFVLRIGGKDTRLLGIDRRVEHEASQAAARAGVGPDVVAFVEPEGYLVTRFVRGRVLAAEELREPPRIAEVGRTLRVVHGGAPLPARFDAFRVVEDYAAIAERSGVGVPSAYARARAVAGEIERARGAQPVRPCHNDLLSANFIDDGERLRIVDWEYAGMGDVLFDLANFAVNNGLDEEGDRALLTAYAGAAEEAGLAALTLMRFMSDFREAMWGVVQQALSELDFDFAGYADEHFARLERTADDGRFRSALEAAPATR